ncbi:unnamed protein product [Clavelina lepadiformis]|uniref:Uncharacterized protein n=1 Tax=Clavelina lepadiformis TaxID=159417 RepID=A0ABP0FEB5_CLALP
MKHLWKILVWIPLFICLEHFVNSQMQNGINLGGRRVSPVRIAAPRTQLQQRGQSPSRQQPSFNQYAPNPNFLNPAFLSRRMNTVEAEVRRISGALSALSSNLRISLSNTLTERLGQVQQDVQAYDVRIADNLRNVDRVSQELEYITNSNANMQKRMDRIEAKQRSQEESIEELESLLESRKKEPSPTSDTPDETALRTTGSEKLDQLSSTLNTLGMRMNDTDSIILGYETYFQSFATNINRISEKTDTLQRSSITNAQSLSQLREDMYNIQNVVQIMQEDDNKDEQHPNAYDSVGFSNLTTAFDELKNNVRLIEENQDIQSSAIQNISALLDSQPNNAETVPDYGDSSLYGDDTQLVMELATTVATLEESVKQVQENQLISFEHFGQRLSELESETTTQQRATLNLQTRVEDLEGNLQTEPESEEIPVSLEEFSYVETDDEASDQLRNLQNQLNNLNMTVTRHSQILLGYNTDIPAEHFAPVNFESQSRIASNVSFITNDTVDYYFSSDDDVLGAPDSIPTEKDRYEIVTTELLERRLQAYRAELNSENVSGGVSFQGINNDLNVQRTRIDTLSRTVNDLKARLPDKNEYINGHQSYPFNVPEKNNRQTHLEFDLNALNLSVAAQGLMLSETIGTLDDYRRRLRIQEDQEQSRMDELQQIRSLFQNASQSISQMSLSVAEHQLTISGILESLQMEDNILLDFNQQIYEIQLSMDALNRTVSPLTRQSPSKEEGNERIVKATAQFPISHNDVKEMDGKNFVSQAEFLALADALTGVAVRADVATKLYKSLENRLENVSFTGYEMPQRMNHSLVEMQEKFDVVQTTVGFQQSVIASLSEANSRLENDVSKMLSFIRPLRDNITSLRHDVDFVGTDRDFIHFLEVSVRNLRTDVVEQRKMLGNQRKRIRYLENTKLDSLSKDSNIVMLNESFAAADITNHEAFHNLSSHNIASNTSVKRLQDQVATIIRRLDNRQDTRDAALASANQFSNNKTVLYGQLKNFPVTMRILETQVQSLQEALQVLPQLSSKVDTIHSMRNLVFQNAADITTFHQSVADLEQEIDRMTRTTTTIQFKNERLNAYQADLRSQFNSTKKRLDQSNDRVSQLFRKFIIFGRYLSGNTTELKDRIQASEVRHDDSDQRFVTVSDRVVNLEGELRQQVSLETLRHNDINTDLIRTKRILKNTEETTTRNSDSIVTLLRSISEESNTRSNAFAEHDDEIQSLRQQLSSLESQNTNVKHKVSQQEQRVLEMSNTQVRNSGSLARLQAQYQTSSEDIQKLNVDLVPIKNDIYVQINKLSTMESDFAELRETSTSRTSNLLSIRQTMITINDEVNSLQQSVQRSDAFMRRAEQAIQKHRSDISFVMDFSTNHSLAIERLKQRIISRGQDSFSNVTREILSEMELLDYNLQNVRDEVSAMKRGTTIRENSAIDFETRLTELANSATNYQNKIRTNKELIDRTRNDVSRNLDRVRELDRGLRDQRTATQDLQQVVILNRNEIASMGDAKDGVDRVKDDFDRLLARQENRTRVLRNTLDTVNGRVSGLQQDLNGHESTLRTLRQDRISFQDNIDQIYRSSANLEELLRVTVTDLESLKRNFEHNAGTRSNVQMLEERTSQIRSEFNSALQTINTNENKVSRVQADIERMTNSIADVISSIRNRDRDSRARESSRLGEIRNVRNQVERTSALLRNAQRELQRNSERLHALDGQILDINTRLAQPFIPHAPEPPQETKNQVDEEDDLLSSSGWIGVPQMQLPVKISNSLLDTFNISSFFNDTHWMGLINTVSQQVRVLTNTVDSIRGDLKEQQLTLDQRGEQIAIVLNQSSQNKQQVNDAALSLLPLVTSHENDLQYLFEKMGDFDSLSFDDLKSEVQSFQEDILKSKDLYKSYELFVNKTNEDLSFVKLRFEERLSIEEEARANISRRFYDIAGAVSNISLDISEHLHVTTEDKLNLTQEAISNLENRFLNISVKLTDLSNLSKELTNGTSFANNKNADLGNVTKNLENALRQRIDSSSESLAEELENLTTLFGTVKKNLDFLIQKIEVIKENLTNDVSADNHTHDEVNQLQAISRSTKQMQTQITSLSGQVSQVKRQRSDAYKILLDKLTENEASLNSVILKLSMQESLLKEHNTTLKSVQGDLKALCNRKNSYQNVSGKMYSSSAVLMSNVIPDLIIELANKLEAFNTTIQSLVTNAVNEESTYTDFQSYTYEYVPGEEQVEVVAKEDVPSVTSEYVESTSSQEFLMAITQNLVNVNSHMAQTLRQIVKEMRSEHLNAVPDNQREISDDGYMNGIELMNMTLMNISKRFNEIEILKHSPSPSSNQGVLDDVMASIGSLRQQVQKLQTERGEKSDNLTRFLFNNVEQLRNEVVFCRMDLANLQTDITLFNVTLSGYSETEDLQDVSMRNMLLMQEKQGRAIDDWKTQSGNFAQQLQNTTLEFQQRMEGNEERVFQRLTEVSQQIGLDQDTLMSEVFSLSDDVASVNFTLDSVLAFITALQEDIRTRTLGVESIPVLRNTMEQHEDFISSILQLQREQETAMNAIFATSSSYEALLSSVSDKLEEVSEDIDTNKNRITDLTNKTTKGKEQYGEEFQNELIALQQQLNNSTSQISEVKSKLESRLNEFDTNINITIQNIEGNIFDIQREIADGEAADQTLDLTLMTHSTELKGLSRSIHTAEQMLRTLSDTVTLNSNQLTLVSNEFLRRSNQGSAFLLLTQITANHTSKLRDLEDQVAILSRNQNPTSVRIVVPPIRSNPARPTTPIKVTPTGPSDQPTSLIPSPTGLRVVSATSTDLTVSWNPAIGINKYRLILRNLADRQETLQITAVAPPVTINNLSPSGQYTLTLHSVINNHISKPTYAFGETAPRPSARPAVPRTSSTTTTTTPTTMTTTTTASTTTSTTASTYDVNAISADISQPQTNVAEDTVFSCDFDNRNICGFTNDHLGNFDWTQHNGTTSSSDTGPTNDHTRGDETGFYMYIEASRPRVENDVARLLSPVMDPTDGACLEFYYHMFGVGIGDFNVMLQLENGTSHHLWSESGDHGNQWNKAKATLVSDHSFTIVFEATVGSNFHSDTALDDVNIKHGACPKPLFQCDFDQGSLCGFIQDSDDDFDWIPNSGATSSADTGPIADNTLENSSGFYLYLESSDPRQTGDITRLSSPLMNPTNAQCLQFYYHMHGSDIGTLNVYLRQRSNVDDLGVPIWSKTGPQGFRWFRGRTSVVSSDSFQFVFEGVRGLDYHGDIAIDDISIRNGLCEQPVCSVGLRFGDVCYKVVKDGKTYLEASAHCRSNGGILATIKTQVQQDFIMVLLNKEGFRWTFFWIGLDDLGREGHFVYSDDTPLDLGANNFGMWAPDEPNDALGDEDCVNIEMSSDKRVWKDVPCNRKNWFICQYPFSQ